MFIFNSRKCRWRWMSQSSGECLWITSTLYVNFKTPLAATGDTGDTGKTASSLVFSFSWGATVRHDVPKKLVSQIFTLSAPLAPFRQTSCVGPRVTYSTEHERAGSQLHSIESFRGAANQDILHLPNTHARIVQAKEKRAVNMNNARCTQN